MKKISAQQGKSAPRDTAIPAGVWGLGFVSLFMDISSEMIHSLLPVFLVSVLGASTLFVGLIEGVAAAAALFTKVFSGALSDYFGRRKIFVGIGYALAALTKPVFAIATSVGWVMAARLTDRVGKGIRGAPRDAWLGDITPARVRGASYGLRQSLDTIGAFAGPLLAILLMTLFANNIRTVFWFAVIPAVIAVMILWFGTKEPEQARPTEVRRRMPIQRADLALLGRAYWGTVVVGGVLTLARFSEAFLVLRAVDVGLSLALVPVVLVVMNIAYAAVSYPAGRLSDRIGRHSLLASGFIVLAIADLVLATASSIGWVMIGVMLWGLHMGLTHGVLAALVADQSPAKLRGTAFGIFNFISGIALLLASLALPGLLALRWLFPGK
jgi:MFS family permease